MLMVWSSKWDAHCVFVCRRQEKFSERKTQALEMRDVGNKIVSRSVCFTSRSRRVVKGSGSIMWWDLGKVDPIVMQRRMEEDRRAPRVSGRKYGGHY